jgi:hypothetical protein
MAYTHTAAKPESNQSGAHSGKPHGTDAHAIRAGADAFCALLDRVREISDATCERFGHGEDGRNYVAMVAAIVESFKANLTGANAKHREGYLRALAYLLCVDADHYIGVDDNWDPLKITERAFALARAGN